LNGLQAAPLLRCLALIGSVCIFAGLGGLPSLKSLCGLLVKLGERGVSVFRPKLCHLIGSNPQAVTDEGRTRCLAEPTPGFGSLEASWVAFGPLAPTPELQISRL